MFFQPDGADFQSMPAMKKEKLHLIRFSLFIINREYNIRGLARIAPEALAEKTK